jgi:hypothetical protein
MREIVRSQLLAALATLINCIRNCPDSEWNEAHGDAPFSQVLFHTLFFLDYYLSADDNEFKAQQFHIEHKSMFRDYEELIDKKAEELYSKEEIQTYMDFCRKKIEDRFGSINEKGFLEKTKHHDMAFLELMIDCTRHVQHHAAQLGLRLQLLSGDELKWFSRG